MYLPVRVCMILIIQSHITQSTKLFPLLKDLGCSRSTLRYDLQSKNISEIGANVFRLCKNLVRIVHLDKNRISKISSSAFEGTKIQLLYLNGNRLKCIPDLHTIKNTLRYLFLDHNRLGQCQMCTQNCTATYKLVSLSLAYNYLTQLPWIVFCTNRLKSINLMGNKFQTLPDLFSMGILRSYSNHGRLLLDDNPFCCGCNVLWVLEWEEGCKGGRGAPYCTLSSPPICTSGPYQGRLWRNLTIYDLSFYCNSTTTTG